MTTDIEVETILATRGLKDSTNGLITFQVQLPAFLWTELLTHKRLARNASSARAQSTSRHIDMGYYEPEAFHKRGTGMQSGDEVLEGRNAEYARHVWRQAWEAATESARILADMGVAKEIANRLIPPIKMMRGVVTATEDAWEKFLALRNHPAADRAMQRFAALIQQRIDGVVWVYKSAHLPYAPELSEDIDSRQQVMIAAARIARVSYDRPKSGRSDLELAEQLIADGHLSPFEHLAFFQVTKHVPPSALYSKMDDECYGFAWKNYRSILEEDSAARAA